MLHLLLAIALTQEPTPIPQRAVAVDPIPMPTAKAVITDRHGNKVPLKVPKGGALFLSAKTATRGDRPESVRWIVTPRALNQRCETVTLLDDDGTKNPCLLVPYGNDFGAFSVIQIVALDDASDWTDIDITVEGGIPPPDPKPDPRPDPPKPETVDHLQLVVVHDALNVAPATAATLNARAFWDGLKVQGHSFIVYSDADTTTPGARCILDAHRFIGKGKAVLLLYDKDTGRLLKQVDGTPAVWPLPDVERLKSLVKEYASDPRP